MSPATTTAMFTQPYRPRSIRRCDLLAYEGWRLKVYSISARQDLPGRPLVEAARMLARTHLPRPAIAPGRYGVGVLIVHEGADGNYVLLDWWEGENMLQHRVFRAPSWDPLNFRRCSPEECAFCVWELHVLHFERGAWIDTALSAPGAPNLDAYLACRLEAQV
ncbi:MAG: isochorismatase [Verrucomicrobia bacterium]|nr:isochorismatase [Verrucomicrobiota bacterium]